MNLHKNFIINAALCCLILGVIGLGIGTPPVFATNVITDVNLKKAINDRFTALGLHGPRTATTPVTVLELQHGSFAELNVNGYGKADSEKIVNLAGLTAATNLVNLDLSHNKIVDISHLSGLVRLKRLNLSGNKIAELGSGGTSHLPLLTLTHLNLANNLLKDTLTEMTDDEGGTYYRGPSDAAAKLRYLSGWVSTNLKVLNVSHNEIANINVVANMTKLEDLIINNNKISDFSPLVRNSDLAADDEVSLGGNYFGVSVETTAAELNGILVDLVEKLDGRYNRDRWEGTDASNVPVSYPGFYESVSSLLMNRGVKLYTNLGEVANIPDRNLRAALKTSVYLQSLTNFSVDELLQAVNADSRIARYRAADPDFLPAYRIEDLRGLIQSEVLTVEVLQRLRMLDLSAESGHYVENLKGLDILCPNLEVLNLEGSDLKILRT